MFREFSFTYIPSVRPKALLSLAVLGQAVPVTVRGMAAGRVVRLLLKRPSGHRGGIVK